MKQRKIVLDTSLKSWYNMLLFNWNEIMKVSKGDMLVI